MNAERKAAWVAALRSGNYKQTKYVLRDPEGFCCLGVLCDISGAGRWVAESFESGDEMRFAIPTDAVNAWLGVSDANLWIGKKHLTDFNDAGVSFAQIADMIESYQEAE